MTDKKHEWIVRELDGHWAVYRWELDPEFKFSMRRVVGAWACSERMAKIALSEIKREEEEL